MSVTRRRIAHAALLGSASFVSLTFATGAQAQCVTNNAQPLGNITVNSTEVQCTGSVSGPVINVNADGVAINVTGSGTTVTGLNADVNGNGNIVLIRNNAVLNGSVLTLDGMGNTIFWDGSGVSNGLVINVTGANSQLLFGTSQVTQNPGQMNISAGVGEQNTIQIFATGGLFAAGGGGQYLLNGGTGNQNVTIEGFFQSATDGLGIALGDGNDTIQIGGSANISAQGGGSVMFDGGSGTDILSLNNSGVWDHNTIGFEVINLNPTTTLTLTGSNADATQINVQGGSVIAANAAALGVANSTIDIGTFGNLELAFAAPTAFDHTLTGAGGLNIASPGQAITFGGDGTGFGGAVNVGAGSTAVIAIANALGTGNITNDGTVTFEGFALANNIGGTGQVIVTGNGNSRLSGVNTFSGGLDIQGGVLDVDSAVSLGTGEVTSSGVFGVLGIGSTADEVLANNLTGNLALVKAGAGVLDLTGSNTYSGGTLIAGGAVRVDDFARLGTGQVIATTDGSLILNYNGAGQLLQTAAFLTGDGRFIKEGSGDVVIDVANTYTGGTTIRAGTVGLNDGQGLGTGTIQVDSGATLGIGGVNLSNAVTGSGTIVKTASNQAALLGDNSGFTGMIDIQSGVIVIEDGRSAGSGSVTIGAGTSLISDSTVGDTAIAADLTGAGNLEKLATSRLTLTGTNTLTGTVFVGAGTLQIEGEQNIGTAAIVLSGAAGVLDLNTAGSTTLGNTISGNGRVVKTGTGTVFLTGANTYAGGTDIQQGALRVTDVSFLGTGGISVQAGAALDLLIAGTQTLNQTVTGAGILRKSGAGDLTLLGNGLTGGVDITGGRLFVGTAAVLGGGPVTTAVDTQLVFDTAGTETISNLISGAGGLTKDGTGVLVIQNANSYTGGTIINAGRLGLNNGQGLGTGDVLVLQGAQLSLGGVTVGNNISGAGQVIKTAGNIGTLTGTNTYSGGTDIQGGSLRVTSPAALGTGGVQIAGGSSLIVDYSGANNVAMANVLSGAGALVKDGSGTVVLNNQGNSYTGGTTINAGRLGLNFGDALGTGGVTIAGGAELGIGAITYGNATSGAGRIVKTSGGAAFLTGTNTHTGGLDIQGGSVGVTGSGALGSGAVSFASGASLDYTAASNATFANALTGGGNFNKLGTAQLTFGSNFSIGTLNALAGRTRINAVATTNATVAAGATLDGTGRIIGNLVNNGTVAPGNSIGTLTVQGNYTHNAGSVLEIEFDANGNIDLLNVTGNAVLNGGTIRFVSIGGAEGQGGTFLSTGGTVTGTFATIETVGAQLPLAVFYTANTAQMAPSVVTARPSTFNAQNLAAADTALGFIEALGIADARHGRGNRLWLSGFGAWGDRAASGATLAYDHDTRGISGGINLAVGGNVTLGAAVGWADGDISLGSNAGGGEQTHTLASFTARWQGTSGLSLGVGALYGQVDQSTLRNVSFNGFSGSVEGATESTIYGGFAEAGIPLGALQGWNIEAGLRGSVIRQEQDGYTESGTSPLRLTLGDLATTTVEGQARLVGTKRLWDASGGQEEDAVGLDLRLDLGLRYLGLQGSREIPVIFAVSNAGIVLQGDTRDTLQGAGGIALDYTTSGGARLSLGYRGEFARTDRHTVQAGVSIGF